MNNTIPGKVSCLLCRGAILFRDGDRSRFYAHMNNEHGAFFDLDYLLASSLMDQAQKEVVIRNVIQTESHNTQVMLGHGLKRERTKDDAEMDSETMRKRVHMGGDTAVVQPSNNDDLHYLHSGAEANMNQSYDDQEQLYYSVIEEEPQVADTNHDSGDDDEEEEETTEAKSQETESGDKASTEKKESPVKNSGDFAKGKELETEGGKAGRENSGGKKRRASQFLFNYWFPL